MEIIPKDFNNSQLTIRILVLPEISILFNFYLNFYKISWATVKNPNGLSQEPSHLVLSEYIPGVFEREFTVKKLRFTDKGTAKKTMFLMF
jgi:hypothetical protein